MKKISAGLLLAMLMAVVLVASCGCNASDVKRKVHNEAFPERVTVYRFGDFSKNKADRLVKSLKAFYPDVELADECIPLPADQYYRPRNRYKGTGLFRELFARRDGNAIVGLTNYVIYAPNELSPTYGIFGIAPVGRYICVCSDKKPRGGMHTEDNFTKLALHELGHAFGLPHCPDQHCYMVDAEHKYKLAQSHYFCSKCRKFLNKKGWTIR